VIDYLGDESTFDPRAPGSPTLVTVTHPFFFKSLACASTTQCTVFDFGGAVTFDPLAPATEVRSSVVGCRSCLLACPSTAQCTEVDQSLGGEWTFNPTTFAGRLKLVAMGGVPTVAVACPSAQRCVAAAVGPRLLYMAIYEAAEKAKIDLNLVTTRPETEVTFNPRAHSQPTHALSVIPDSAEPTAVACPSARQCTIVDSTGGQRTFDPGRPPWYKLGLPRIDAAGLTSIACPSRRQCTAVDDRGREVTFDPTSRALNVTYDGPYRPAVRRIDTAGLTSVACPSLVQCTAVDDKGREVTFDPTSPRRTAARRIDTTGLTSIACPTLPQCTAVDGAGREITLDPTRPGKHTTTHAIDTSSLSAAVDGAGREITLDPTRPGKHTTTHAIDTSSLSAVACPSTRFCVAVDSNGSAVEGDPAGDRWVTKQITRGTPLLAVSCSSVSQCVAVDPIGNAYIGRS
jgi:hypothetical protein